MKSDLLLYAPITISFAARGTKKVIKFSGEYLLVPLSMQRAKIVCTEIGEYDKEFWKPIVRNSDYISEIVYKIVLIRDDRAYVNHFKHKFKSDKAYFNLSIPGIDCDSGKLYRSDPMCDVLPRIKDCSKKVVQFIA